MTDEPTAHVDQADADTLLGEARALLERGLIADSRRAYEAVHRARPNQREAIALLAQLSAHRDTSDPVEMARVTCPSPGCHRTCLVSAADLPGREVVGPSDPPTFHLRPGGALTLVACSYCGMCFLGPRRSARAVCTACQAEYPLPQDYASVECSDEASVAKVLAGTFAVATCPQCEAEQRLQFPLDTGLFQWEVASAITAHAQDAKEHLENARTYALLRLYDRVRESYRQALGDGEASVAGGEAMPADWVFFAVACDHTGEVDGAVRAMRKAVQQAPFDGRALHGLALALLKTDNGPEAVDVLETIIEERVEISDMFVDNLHFRRRIMLTLASLCRELGRAEDAARWNKQVRRLVREHPFLES